MYKIGSDCISIIEVLVVIMYDCSSSTNDSNKAKLYLYARKQKLYNPIPPSIAAKTEHVKLPYCKQVILGVSP